MDIRSRLEIALQKFAETTEFTKTCMRLDLAPCIEFQVKRKVQTGLSRRLMIQPGEILESTPQAKGKSKEPEVINNTYGMHTCILRCWPGKLTQGIDVWFLLPLVDLDDLSEGTISQEEPALETFRERLGQLKVPFKLLGLTVGDKIACFYMKHNITTRKTTIFFTKTVDELGKLNIVCEMGARLDLRGDPFALLCTAISEIIDEWSLGSTRYYDKFRKIVSQHSYFILVRLSVAN